MASKIIALSATDAAEAQEKLQEWLAKDDKVLFIVLGDTNIAKETVKRADKLSGGALQEPRWVIHAPTREHVFEILKTLQDPGNLIEDWDKVLAIAVSITDVVREMIIRDGSQPTFSQIDDAYMFAEADGT